MVNKNNTLTVEHLVHAVADGLIRMDMPIGVISPGFDGIKGVDAFELCTFKDGTKVFVIHTESMGRLVSYDLPETAQEVGF